MKICNVYSNIIVRASVTNTYTSRLIKFFHSRLPYDSDFDYVYYTFKNIEQARGSDG